MNALFYSSERRLPVLMYHKVSRTDTDYLTISTRQLEEQLTYLKESGYHFITMAALIQRLEEDAVLPERSILISFDDGYLSTLELAYPILKKYDAKACIFLPTYFLGKGSDWDEQPAPLMSVDQIKNLDPAVFEVGLHSHRHQHYKTLNAEEIRADVRENWNVLEENGIDFVPAFAYPYGGRPKRKQALGQMKEILTKQGIQLAFRIGNRINLLPRKAVGDVGTAFLEMCRIDVRGNESLKDFKRKVRIGKFRLF